MFRRDGPDYMVGFSGIRYRNFIDRLTNYVLLIALISGIGVREIAGVPTAGQQHLLRLLAVPWLDRHPSDSHRLSHQTTTCSLAVSPVRTQDNDLAKGTFVHFSLADVTFIVRASQHNGRFCAVEIFRMDIIQKQTHIRLMANTKLQYQVLDIKASVCGPTEAYIIAIITKDGKSTEPQLLVFKRDDKEPSGQTFVIAHNTQLASMKGVSDVSISCFANHVVFGLAASSSLLNPGTTLYPSSVRVWSPKSRAVVKQLTAETVNAISVVAFEDGRCLILIFMQKSNALNDGPLDSLVYCLMLEAKTTWRLSLVQRLNLCEVSGVEMYLSSKNELGLFVAVSKKADDYPGCPRTSLSMKWTGRSFVPYGNVSVKAVTDFYYYSSTCCNLLLARHMGEERALTFVGSTEPLFEGVHKMEFLSVAKRSFLLISFASDIHHGALHELFCDERTYKALPFGPPGWMPFRPAPPPIPAGAMMHVTPPQMGFISGPPPVPAPPMMTFPPVYYEAAPPVQQNQPPPFYPSPPLQNQGFFIIPENRDFHSMRYGNRTFSPFAAYAQPIPIMRQAGPPIRAPPMPPMRPPSSPYVVAAPWSAPRPAMSMARPVVVDPRLRKRMHAFDDF